MGQTAAAKAAATWPEARATEWASLGESGHQVRQIASLPDVPAVILTSGQPEGWVPEMIEAGKVLQGQWLSLLPHGRQVIVEDAGRATMLSTHPRVIVDAIREVVEAARE
mgnify:CR=1 FL=1